jgi:3-methyladenine DNA glycosylase AlkC
MPAKKFSLKDHLFNKEKVARVSSEIASVYPEFKKKQFIHDVTTKFPELELMERMYWMRACLREYLPADYRVAVEILIKSLPSPLSTELTDDDFGDYIYGAYGNFVSEYGATAQDVDFSLAALREMTTRFSCEFPIRVFIDAFPEKTLAVFVAWSADGHYHVRRLVSEGTRPKLPWGKNISLDYTIPIPFLDILHADSTRFVTRSVANHLNDISKIDPELSIKTLNRWKSQKIQSEKELDFITRHSLRTLIKKGHMGALNMLGFSSVKMSTEVIIRTPEVKIGESLVFDITIQSQSKIKESLMIDYILYFQKAAGSLAPKTYKITKTSIRPGETISLTKHQLLREMSTRKIHTGKHQVELQINGQKSGKHTFHLIH